MFSKGCENIFCVKNMFFIDRIYSLENICSV